MEQAEQSECGRTGVKLLLKLAIVGLVHCMVTWSNTRNALLGS
jgi:hypothetical protein